MAYPPGTLSGVGKSGVRRDGCREATYLHHTRVVTVSNRSLSNVVEHETHTEESTLNTKIGRTKELRKAEGAQIYVRDEIQAESTIYDQETHRFHPTKTSDREALTEQSLDVGQREFRARVYQMRAEGCGG